MADDLNIAQILGLGQQGGSVDTILLVFMIIIIAAACIAAVLFIVMLLQYKHKFRIIDKTNKVPRIRDDKARIVRDKDGVEKWQLLKLKKFAPQPSSDFISLTTKGKFSVEAEYTEENGFEYILPENKEIQKSQDSLTTSQKIFLVNEFKKAELDKPKDWKEIIQQAVPIVAFVIIIALLVFGAESYFEAVNKTQDKTQGVLSEIGEIVQEMKEIEQIKQGIQPVSEEERPD